MAEMLWLAFLMTSVTVTQSAGPECIRTSACSCTMSDGSGSIDLSPLNNSGNKPRFLDQNATEVPDAFHYSWNPCQPFSEGKNGDQNCQNVAVCQIIPATQIFINLGMQESSTFKRRTDGHWTLQYQHFDSVISVTRTTTVVLLCDTMEEAKLVVRGEIEHAHYVFRLQSRYACITK